MKYNYNTGQTAVTVIMWAIGLIATAGLGLNINGMNINAGQDTKISDLNRETGMLITDIKYIRETVDDLKEAQKIQLQSQGLYWKIASTTAR